jgi:hypothetical protein
MSFSQSGDKLGTVGAGEKSRAATVEDSLDESLERAGPAHITGPSLGLLNGRVNAPMKSEHQSARSVEDMTSEIPAHQEEGRRLRRVVTRELRITDPITRTEIPMENPQPVIRQSDITFLLQQEDEDAHRIPSSSPMAPERETGTVFTSPPRLPPITSFTPNNTLARGASSTSSYLPPPQSVWYPGSEAQSRQGLDQFPGLAPPMHAPRARRNSTNTCYRPRSPPSFLNGFLMGQQYRHRQDSPIQGWRRHFREDGMDPEHDPFSPSPFYDDLYQAAPRWAGADARSRGPQPTLEPDDYIERRLDNNYGRRPRLYTPDGRQRVRRSSSYLRSLSPHRHARVEPESTYILYDDELVSPRRRWIPALNDLTSDIERPVTRRYYDIPRAERGEILDSDSDRIIPTVEDLYRRNRRSTRTTPYEDKTRRATVYREEVEGGPPVSLTADALRNRERTSTGYREGAEGGPTVSLPASAFQKGQRTVTESGYSRESKTTASTGVKSYKSDDSSSDSSDNTSFDSEEDIGKSVKTAPTTVNSSMGSSDPAPLKDGFHVKLKGNAKIKLAGMEVECEDGIEFNFTPLKEDMNDNISTVPKRPPKDIPASGENIQITAPNQPAWARSLSNKPEPSSSGSRYELEAVVATPDEKGKDVQRSDVATVSGSNVQQGTYRCRPKAPSMAQAHTKGFAKTDSDTEKNMNPITSAIRRQTRNLTEQALTDLNSKHNDKTPLKTVTFEQISGSGLDTSDSQQVLAYHVNDCEQKTPLPDSLIGGRAVSPNALKPVPASPSRLRQFDYLERTSMKDPRFASGISNASIELNGEEGDTSVFWNGDANDFESVDFESLAASDDLQPEPRFALLKLEPLFMNI